MMMEGAGSQVALAAAAVAISETQASGHAPPASGSPLGLLRGVNLLRVQQESSFVEAISSWEESNKYKVMNAANAQIYYAYEDSNTCCRQCCGADRGFELIVAEPGGTTAFKVIRDFKCCAILCDCCACMGCCQHGIRVEDANGQLLGTVYQNCTICSPKYTVTDSDEQPICSIHGPCFCCRSCFSCCMFCDLAFDIHSESTGDELGCIKKKFSGVKEMIGDADNFEVSFPGDMDVRMKAVLVGACFFIDFRHFEKGSNEKSPTEKKM